MYGLNHGVQRFDPEMSMHLRAESGIPGLWLTGNKNIFLLKKMCTF